MRSCTYIPDVSLYVQFGNLMTQQKCSTLISHLATGMHLIHRLVTPGGQQQFSLNVPRKLPSFQAAGQVPPGSLLFTWSKHILLAFNPLEIVWTTGDRFPFTCQSNDLQQAGSVVGDQPVSVGRRLCGWRWSRGSGWVSITCWRLALQRAD